MFKIANVPMVEFPQFKMFVPDVTIRILDTIKVPENPAFPNLEFSPNPFPDAKEYTFRFDDVSNEKDPNCITDGEYTTDAELRDIFIDPVGSARLAEVKFISLQARFCRDLLAAMLKPELNIREFVMNWSPWS